MNARTQVSIDPEMQRRAQARAADLGISFAEYVRRLVWRDLSEPKQIDISVVFDLVSDGPSTNVARDRDQMVAEAVWDEHQRCTTRKRRTSPKSKMRTQEKGRVIVARRIA